MNQTLPVPPMPAARSRATVEELAAIYAGHWRMWEDLHGTEGRQAAVKHELGAVLESMEAGTDQTENARRLRAILETA